MPKGRVQTAAVTSQRVKGSGSLGPSDGASDAEHSQRAPENTKQELGLTEGG